MAPCKHRTKGATVPHSLCVKKNAIKKCSQVLWFSYFTTLFRMSFICNSCFCIPYDLRIAWLQDLGAQESCQIRPSLCFPRNTLPSQTGSSSRIEITNDSVTTWKPHRGRKEMLFTSAVQIKWELSFYRHVWEGQQQSNYLVGGKGDFVTLAVLTDRNKLLLGG